MSDIKTVGEKLPSAKPKLAMINFDGTWHEIQEHASMSVCGKVLNSNKMKLATTDVMPIGGNPCQACAEKKLELAKRRKNRQLNRRFEDHKQWVQRTGGVGKNRDGKPRKNTLGRKQVFKQSDRFEM